MRNFKRFLALVLSILMLNGMIFISANAAEAGDYTDAAKRLSAVGILKGDGKGNLMLGSAVKRWQTALFFMQVMTGITDATRLNAVKESDYFTDVTEYGTAIDQAYGFGVVKGRGDGTYGYNDNIIYQDMLVMAVRALGYETKDMVYPYGHILTADKLGLTKNMAADIAYNKPLTRGETAQIIWNTLGVQIAVTDPVTDKILYPDEVNVFDIERQTFLEKSGFSQGKMEGVIVKYTPAVKASDIETVTVRIDGSNKIFKANDLGIDEDVFKNEYLGLPVTIYVNYKNANDFFANYDYKEEENKGKVVIVDIPELELATNLGEEGNIKYVAAAGSNAAYVVLGEEKFAFDKYNTDIRVLDAENGWVSDASNTFTSAFLYTSKDGYIGTNSYGEVMYSVIPAKTANANPTLLILYTPYAFGRYAVRSITYQPLSVASSIVTIATFDANRSESKYYNFDGTETLFVEHTLGKNGTEVAKGIKSVSELHGKLSYSVLVDDQYDTANNDYVFYAYNELDNVLKIAYNCEAAQAVSLTGYSENKETLRINSKDYKFGFPGAFANDLPLFDKNVYDSYINNLNKIDKNAYAVVFGDNVLYTRAVSTNKSDVTPYAILSVEKDRLMDLMDLTSEEFDEKAVTVNSKKFIFNEKGIVAARYDASSNEWSLETIVAYDRYANSEFYEVFEFTKYVKQVNMIGTLNLASTGADKTFKDILGNIDNGVVLLREERDDGLVVSFMPTDTDYNSHKDRIDYYSHDGGLSVSDTGLKTNKIRNTNDSSVTTGRKTLNAKSTIVVIDKNGTVAVRNGIYDSSASVDTAAIKAFDSSKASDYKLKVNFLTASNSLIVMYAYNDDITAFLKAWESNSAAKSDEGYFIVTNKSEIGYEVNADKTYTFTLSDVFDITNNNTETLTYNVDKLSDAQSVISGFKAGAIIYRNAKNVLSISTKTYGDALLTAKNNESNKDKDFYNVNVATLDFADFESITAPEFDLTKDDAIMGIEVSVASVNVTSLDDDYDFTKIALDKSAFDPESNKYTADSIDTVRFNEEGDKYYEYSLTKRNAIAEVSEPTSGVFDNYILATNGAKLHIASNDDNYFETAKEIKVNLYVCGRFNEDTGVLTLKVLRVISDYAE